MTITPALRTTLSITRIVVVAAILGLGAALITDIISAPTARMTAAYSVVFLAGVDLVLLVISRLTQVTDQPHTRTAPAA